MKKKVNKNVKSPFCVVSACSWSSFDSRTLSLSFAQFRASAFTSSITTFSFSSNLSMKSKVNKESKYNMKKKEKHQDRNVEKFELECFLAI